MKYDPTTATLENTLEGLTTMLRNMERLKDHETIRKYVGENYTRHVQRLNELGHPVIAQAYRIIWKHTTGYDL